MRLDDLAYELPPELIAQEPVEPRDASRLLVLGRASGALEDRVFSELPELLRPDDVVVLNTTRVIPARLRLRRATGGAAEVLLLEALADGTWESLVRPARRLRPGERLAGAGIEAEVVEVRAAGEAVVRLHADGPLDEALERAGEMPLPPYIARALDDPDRYQTVYAERPGSAAAPTAGLHFTPQLLERVRDLCQVEEVELQVGLDTFRPVQADDLDRHPMHSERYAVDPDVRARIVEARARGRRVVAVGTTTVRVLETIADPAAPDRGRTALLIQPGHRFGLVDALITNFHLPRSTLLALVMALGGESPVRAAYAHAVRERYRFYSFGDAMLIA
jgi:S-adenosylmethionine:tRNA ribosyltransferase-isomerase